MNVAAFNVAAMNIHHIIECSSPDSATFDILFCLFRTWSLRLSTNSAASLPMTKFSECASSWELALSSCPDPSPYGMRISVEKRFFTMRSNLLHRVPRSFIRFLRSIVRRSLTFPLLRRPRTTKILF